MWGIHGIYKGNIQGAPSNRYGIHKIYKGVNVVKKNIHTILRKSIRGSIALMQGIQKGVHKI